MHRRRALIQLCAALPLALAALPVHADDTRSFAEVAASPKLLREAADDAVARMQAPLAFRTLMMLRTLHPESEESAEAFTLACSLFKPAWRIQRLKDPTSHVAASDPVFMFVWLESFYEGGEEFPTQQATALLRGMPTSFFKTYRAFTRRPNARPEAAQWEIAYEEDNGLVTGITATHAAKPVAGTGG
jgi:hypothetical protein